MNRKKYSKEECIRLLCAKYGELGESRYPQRSDFDEDEVVAIKAFLGPWPRALEAAAIKPPRNDDRLQKNREKRIKSKRARLTAKKNSEAQAESSANGNK